MSITYRPKSPCAGFSSDGNSFLIYSPSGGCRTGTGDANTCHIESGILGVTERGVLAPNYNDPQVYLELGGRIEISPPDYAVSHLPTSPLESEYALVSGDKAVCLKYLPPGAFTGMMRDFMCALYGSDNPLARYTVVPDETGFAEFCSISLSDGADETEYVALGNSLGNTSVIYVYETAENLEFYLLSIGVVAITARKMRFGRAGMQWKEVLRTDSYPEGVTPDMAVAATFADFAGFCPPKTHVYSVPAHSTEPLAYGWHARDDGKEARILHLSIGGTVVSYAMTQLTLSVDSKGRPAATVSRSAFSAPFALRRTADLVWSPVGKGTGYAGGLSTECLNATWEVTQAPLANGGVILYLVCDGASFKNLVYSYGAFGAGAVLRDTGWQNGQCYNGSFFGSPATICCGNDTRSRLVSAATGYRCGFDNVLMLNSSGIYEYYYDAVEQSQAGRTFEVGRGDATYPWSCEPWKPYPNNYIEDATYMYWRYTANTYHQYQRGNTAIVIPHGDCEGYYRFGLGEKYNRSLVSGSEYTTAQRRNITAYNRTYDGSCYGAQIGKYTLRAAFYAPFTTGSVNVTNSCTGAVAFSYNRTNVTPPAPSPELITDGYIRLRWSSKTHGGKIPFPEVGVYSAFPGIDQPIGSPILATTGINDGVYRWEDDKDKFFSGYEPVGGGVFRFTGWQ